MGHKRVKMKIEKKRHIDKPSDYKAFCYLEVKCPYCNGMGIVTREDDCFSFQCTVCGKRQQKDRTYYRYHIGEMCDNCERFFRIDIEDENQQHFKILNVNCPHCNQLKHATIQKISLNCKLDSGEVRKGVEPYFGFPLYYQTSFGEKIIWAYNRNHLLYLIDYVDADIRETTRTCQSDKASYFLPKFISLAKNRNQIVKLLKRLLYNE
jgi:DNA-directed RNA polymerase subunit M/transcription elongation factor TFIIS